MKNSPPPKAKLLEVIQAKRPDPTPPNRVCQAALSDENRALGACLHQATQNLRGAVLPSVLLPPML